jgi:4-hydroxybenzoate polyprenyltransferase
MAALLWLYNLKLKSLPLWGNLAVAALCALAVYFPEFPGLPKFTGLPAVFAFLATLAREIAKDSEDVPGDKSVGWNTFPIRYGKGVTRNIIRVLTILIFALLPLPYFWLDYHRGYYLLILLGPVPLLIALLRGLSSPFPDWGRIQQRFKWLMLAGMAAIFVGIYV